MAVTFGERVVGADAYKKAVEEQEGGADVFGARVRGALSHESNPDDIAKANSEFGPRTVVGASAQNHKGEEGEVSVEDIGKILDVNTGNTTFLDSLYENELARAGGPRKEAIAIMYQVERSHKGQMRPGIMSQMEKIMGTGNTSAKDHAAAADVMLQQVAEQQRLSEENLLLADAPRAKALRERQENIDLVKEQQGKEKQAGEPLRELKSLADITSQSSGTPSGAGAAETGTSQEGEGEEATPVEDMSREELEAEAVRLGIDTNDGKGELADGAYSVDQLRKLVQKG